MWSSVLDEERLRAEWTAAAPFPHVVVDDFPAPQSLIEVLEEEPVETYAGDIYRFDATAPKPKTRAFAELRDAFAATYAPALSRVSGTAVTRADMRAYAYRAGHYLLPHTDHQTGVGRAIAYAHYLPSPEPPVDGALELFACTAQGGDIVRTESSRVIAPIANRIVFFEVSDVSLHQVREVLGGLRASLAGWFYP